MKSPTSRASRSRVRVITLAVLLGTGPSAAQAQPAAQALVERWLLRTCDVEAGVLERSLRSQADQATPILQDNFRIGPPARLVAEVEQAAFVRFAQRRRTLAQPNGTGLSTADLARAAADTEADFVARARDSFVLGYRFQAIRGLLLVRPELARSLLQREVRDPSSPFRAAAGRLLTRLR